MPPRRKPTSTKQKKAEQQLRRAIKRGDVPPPEPKKGPHHRKPKHGRIGPTGQLIGANPDTGRAVESARKLQSAFVNVPPKYLEETKMLASTMPLPRPIPDQSAVYVDFATEYQNESQQLLSCPKRPKWRFDMSKLEVEKNEEGLFKKWLAQMDELTCEWQQRDVEPTQSASQEDVTHSESLPPVHEERLSSPTYFERNLEVWRQLWRVAEISQIILVLLDSRCPILHYPPSLATYLSGRKVILVLTKVDITGPVRTQVWIEFLHKRYPDMRIVPVESYIEKDPGPEHQGRVQYEPYIPDAFRERLVEAIRGAHSELVEPPERVKTNPKSPENWISPVKRDVDWESVLNARDNKVGTAVGGAAVPRAADGGDSTEGERDREPDLLTIGLIGQPNVGKSSLLNALFGARRVRASKTPGKTKHFQTLYWTVDVRLVDCPGLVMPNYIPMEMQVLSGILPISRVSAVPACIYFASQILPLENIFKLEHPDTKLPAIEDKRTWRDSKKPESEKQKPQHWTAMDILVAYADAKGWVTAKAGRPDIHRAGNAILRALAEGRIPWAFWPPGTETTQIGVENKGEKFGIWIQRDTAGYEIGDNSDQDNSDEDSKENVGKDSDSEYSEDEDEEEEVKPTRLGRFGALSLQDGAEEESESEEPNESDV